MLNDEWNSRRFFFSRPNCGPFWFVFVRRMNTPIQFIKKRKPRPLCIKKRIKTTSLENGCLWVTWGLYIQWKLVWRRCHDIHQVKEALRDVSGFIPRILCDTGEEGRRHTHVFHAIVVGLLTKPPQEEEALFLSEPFPVPNCFFPHVAKCGSKLLYSTHLGCGSTDRQRPMCACTCVYTCIVGHPYLARRILGVFATEAIVLCWITAST